MRVTKTIVAANSPVTGQKVNTIAGLPARTAVFYVLLFATSVLLYGTLWQSAPLMIEDSPAYLRAAQDLSDFQIDQLQIRTPGYPVLLLLTGSSQGPTRQLFFTSLLLHFVSIWLLASVLSRAGLTGRTLNLFGVLLVLPPYVEYAGYVLAENLTEFMLVAGFVSLVIWFLRRGTAWLIASAGGNCLQRSYSSCLPDSCFCFGGMSLVNACPVSLASLQMPRYDYAELCTHLNYRFNDWWIFLHELPKVWHSW